MSIKDKFSKDRMAKFFDREGFYIVLFLCVCIVAITAVWVSRSGVKNDQNSNLGGVKDNKTTINAPNTPSTETSTSTDDKSKISASDDGKVSKTENSNNIVASKENTPVPAKSASSSPVVKMDNPIKDGMTAENIIRDYSPEDLVCFQYLNEWRVHQGVDVKTSEGTEVLAADDGRVVDVRNDNEGPGGMGWTVVINHNNGYQTTYSNLSEVTDVKKDQTVKRGQRIGTVGNTSIIERENTAESGALSHLHFEVLKKGAKSYENVDPKKYLTMQK